VTIDPKKQKNNSMIRVPKIVSKKKVILVLPEVEKANHSNIKTNGNIIEVSMATLTFLKLSFVTFSLNIGKNSKAVKKHCTTFIYAGMLEIKNREIHKIKVSINT